MLRSKHATINLSPTIGELRTASIHFIDIAINELHGKGIAQESLLVSPFWIKVAKMGMDLEARLSIRKSDR